MEHETFWMLMHSAAHWEFEIFLMLIVDGLLGALILPRFKKWTSHHQSDDDQLATLQKQVKVLQQHLGIKDDKP